MKKRLRVKSHFIINLILFCIVTIPIISFTDKPKQKPNIIFLLADDLRYNALSCMGNPIIQTPTIDKLANKGTLFTKAYATTPICAISRASILSGQYSKRHGMQDFEMNFTDSARMNNYPEILHQNGYYTGFIGKYGVGTIGINGVSSMPVNDFDYWKGFAAHGVYFYKDSNGNQIHSTDMIANQSIDFLETRDKTKPFCLSVSFKAPHVEDGSPTHNGFIYSPFYEKYYSKQTIPPSCTGDDKYYLAFPETFRINTNGLVNEARIRWGLRFSTIKKYQESVKSYYRLITGMDDAIKRIIIELKKTGADKNTVIIFCSDNGYSLGDHGLEGKWYGHDVSLKLPLIVYDGRQPKNKSINNNIALNIDIAPTILDYAGIAVPAAMQGKSLKPLAEGKKRQWRTDFYYDHLFESDNPASPLKDLYIPKSEGLVNLSYKYVRYFNGSNPDNFFYEELYDNKNDSL